MIKKTILSILCLGLLGACAPVGIKHQPTAEELADLAADDALLEGTFSTELGEALDGEETEESVVQ